MAAKLGRTAAMKYRQIMRLVLNSDCTFSLKRTNEKNHRGLAFKRTVTVCVLAALTPQMEARFLFAVAESFRYCRSGGEGEVLGIM